MPDQPNLEDALRRLASALTRLNLEFTVVGGVAVIAQGYRRATFDVDALVLGAIERREELLEALLAEGIQQRLSPIELQPGNLVMHLQTEEGTSVDVLLGFVPLEEEIVRRSTSYEFGDGLHVPVAKPEDLVILKLLAMRKKDEVDIVELLRIWPEMDLSRIRRIIGEFAEALDEPSMVARMDELLED